MAVRSQRVRDRSKRTPETENCQSVVIGPPCAGPVSRLTLVLFLQASDDAEVLQGRDIALDLAAAGHFLEQPPHDLSAARLGQGFRETDLVGLCQRADLLAHGL